MGSSLAEELSSRGNSVTLADLAFDAGMADSEVRKVVCDVLDYDRLREASESSDTIVHLAGISRVEDGERNPGECIRTNLGSTRNVIRVASEGRKAIVFASSREVYGNTRELPVDEASPKRPVSVYGQCKKASEDLLAEAASRGHLDYVVVRLSNVYGSTHDRPERVVPTFVRLALSGANLMIHGGSQTMDFTFIDDVARALARFAESARAISGESYNIVTGRSQSILGLAEMIKRLTNSDSEFDFHEERSFYARNFSANPSKAKAYLVGKVRMRELEEGLGIYLKRVQDERAAGPKTKALPLNRSSHRET